MTQFADVILPLPLPGTFTYRVPAEYDHDIKVGQRVVVQFGSKKLYSALVRHIHENAPQFTAKYILSIIDAEPIVTEQQFQFWEWIAKYYMSTIGEVMSIALPTALKLASESAITIHPDFDGELSALTQHQMQIVSLLSEYSVMKLDDVSRALGVKKIMPIINTMIEQQIIVMDEDIKERFKPKTATYLLLNPIYKEDIAAKELFDSLEKSTRTQKQLTVMLKFMQLSHCGEEAILKKQLSGNDLSASALNTLIKNQILLVEERFSSRLEHYDSITSPDTIELNEEQQRAYDYLCQPDAPDISLLHGVTSSGKTEVYIKLIQKTIATGKQVLFLLPEIALTAQIINRLRKFFGDQVGVYHSKFSPTQRAEVWNKTRNPDPEQRYKILLGARSAMFLPFVNLGLVIIDEEHDSSYKQYDPAPRYNGRDGALYLARLCGARAVLGSATPSIETYFAAQQGRYGYCQMTHRFGGIQMPEILCADLKEAYKRKEMHGYFSNFLLRHIEEALQNQEQVILFQNRRGFSLHLECEDCHWVPQCRNCDVSLVYHKNTNTLRCHYCGYSIPVPSECPQCHSHYISMRGFGTERVEDDLQILFPHASIARLDMDVASSRNRYMEILNDFQDRRIDILVGTQMVTKGLDFDNVSVVGILSADNLINFPDFRSYERSFQQMTQVSGRAGRHGHQGKVIIQTFNPYHQAIRDVIDHNYERMYKGQITDRRVFLYPPYYRIITFTLKHGDENILNEAAATLATQMRTSLGNRVMGPEYPSVKRVRGLYIKNIMVRFERGEAIAQAKSDIWMMCHDLTARKEFSRLRIDFDVDPQ